MNKEKFKVVKEIEEIEVFYFGSFIYLQLAHLYPFRDGNGRVVRLIEKWFVAKKSGHDFWEMPSE